MKYFKLENYSSPFIITFGFAQIFLLGVLDFFTGFELSFAIFYLIPVAMTAWFCEKKAALVTSVFGAVMWQFSNYLAGEQFSNSFVPIWNTSTRFIFFLVVIILITKLKEVLAHEAALARTDFLTGAANPRAFYESAQMEINRCRRYKRSFTLAFFDADNFKMINDAFGHHVGSDLLVRVVKTIKQDLRATDSIARIGGDEFAVLFVETNLEQARIVVNKLRDKLQAEMDSEGWAVTFSIGLLVCINPPESVDELIKIADDLMYEVKRNGKNSVKYKELINIPNIQISDIKESSYEYVH